MTDEARPTVKYWAISVLSSRTTWLSAAAFVYAVSSMPEVTRVVPLRYMPTLMALGAIAAFYLRTQTVRPVAFIRPGTTKAVEVDKIGPPPPAAVTD